MSGHDVDAAPRTAIASVVALALVAGAGFRPEVPRDACTAPPLAHERRDVATIRRLEQAWSVAFLRGDTAFVACLLSPAFTEIVSTGDLWSRLDELRAVARNQGARRAPPTLPRPDVVLQGDVAVAYGPTVGGATLYSDAYVWEGGRWHAVFAQQTRVREHSPARGTRPPDGELNAALVVGWQSLQPVSSPRGPALLLVKAMRYRGRTTLDSAVVLRTGLAPLWEVMRSQATVTRYEYDGAHVRRTRTTPDSAPQTREHAFRAPVFHFNEKDILMRCVPLHAGYETLLPLYSEGDDSLEVDTAQVIGHDAHGIWTLRFADPAIVATVRVRAGTREQVSYSRILRSNGTQVSQVLLPRVR